MDHDLIYVSEKFELDKKQLSILDFDIDTSYYEYKGPKVVRIINID